MITLHNGRLITVKLFYSSKAQFPSKLVDETLGLYWTSNSVVINNVQTAWIKNHKGVKKTKLYITLLFDISFASSTKVCILNNLVPNNTISNVKIRENIVQGIKATKIRFLFKSSAGNLTSIKDLVNNKTKAHIYKISIMVICQLVINFL